MNRQQQINEIMELMNIPEFEKLIGIKVEELKIILDKQIKLYRNLKSEFSHGAEKRRLRSIENKSLEPVKETYFFELNRIEDTDHTRGCKWILRRMEPEPELDAEEVIPDSLIEILSSHSTDPLKIEFDEFYSDRLAGKLDVRSIKYNDARIFGTLRLISQNKKVTERSGTITLDVPREEMEQEQRYTELFRYMEKYPQIREHIFTYFYMIQKPMVDNAAGVIVEHYK